MFLSFASVISAEKDCHGQIFYAEISNAVVELASVVIKCGPHHGKHMAA
jgi:tubulin alpha